MILLAFVCVGAGVEAIFSWAHARGWYEWRDTELTLGLAFGWLVGGAIATSLEIWVMSSGYNHRIAHWGAAPLGLPLAFLLSDLIYYLWHRLSHVWPWLWASHFPHHTAQRMNVLASLRQGWTDALSGTWLFWLPLALLGFSPEQIGAYFAVLLAVQALAHNEWASKWGPIEWVFVTPSHHRVHHSLEAAHFDHNFGGVLIVWDRLFGTLALEGSRQVREFGLPGFDANRCNPLAIATQGWRDLGVEIVRRVGARAA